MQKQSTSHNHHRHAQAHLESLTPGQRNSLRLLLSIEGGHQSLCFHLDVKLPTDHAKNGSTIELFRDMNIDVEVR